MFTSFLFCLCIYISLYPLLQPSHANSSLNNDNLRQHHGQNDDQRDVRRREPVTDNGKDWNQCTFGMLSFFRFLVLTWLFICFSYILIDDNFDKLTYILLLFNHCDVWCHRRTETRGGGRDASASSWPPGMFFFSFLHAILIFLQVYPTYVQPPQRITPQEDSNVT